MSKDMRDEVPRDGTGGCACGTVRYRVDGPMKQVIACHCSICRRQTSHFLAFTAAWTDQLTVTGADRIAWYRSSETSRRGFCSDCGSFLFFETDGAEKVSISAGSLDDDTGFHLVAHIHADDKAGYYEIADSAPRWPQGGDDVPMPPRDA